MTEILLVLFALLSLAGFAASFFFYNQSKGNKGTKQLSELEAIEKASEIAKSKIMDAENKASEIEKQALEKSKEYQSKIKDQEKDLNEREKKLIERRDRLDKRFDELDQKENSIEEIKKELKEQENELGKRLEKVANLSEEEAQKQLKEQTEKELNDWIAKKVHEADSKIKNESEEIAQKYLTEAMINSAVDYTSETTTTTVTIDDEKLKGRIIGREGRNIRTFEKLTGVDVVVDEAPNQVTISCFDPIRREVGALALQRLLKEGKIHPSSIEETIKKVKKDLLREIKKTGEEIAYETGFNDLPNEIIMLLGRFKYRYSYGQNLVKHSLEMAKLGEALAHELGADVETAKLACLLHDIGKVAPEDGKQHHHISAEIAAKYFKNNDRLINAIEAHHYDREAKFIEAEIVRIADAISGARPGARRDSYEEYVKRMRALEDIANKNPGVKEAYAIKSGREVRVIVKPKEVTDQDTDTMAYKIAKEIEDTQSYPGIVEVNVIREYRAKGEAK